MKKILLIATIFTMSILSASAQRHIKGIKTFELTAGISPKSYMVSAYVAKFFTSRVYLKGGLIYETGSLKTLDLDKNENVNVGFNAYYVDALGAYSLLKIKETIFINPFGGLSFAYDNVKSLEYAPKQSGVIVGGVAGLETEIFFSDKLAFVVNASQRYYKSKFGNARFFASAGFKYNF